MNQVIKRNGSLVDFDKQKIYIAIMKAMEHGSGIIKPSIAQSIADEIEDDFNNSENNISIFDIENKIFNKLIAKKQKLTAKAYESYRSIQEFKRNRSELDVRIEGIVDGTNKDAIDENSNKNAYIASTQRDLIAGEYSKDYSRRTLLPVNILHAHDEGILHMHDLDYFLEHIHNCFDVNTKFITSNGMKSFADFKDGDIISVLSLDGKYHQAKVRCYGIQPLYKYTFYNGKKEYSHEVLATENHRWILKDNTETLNLSIGDKLVKAPVIYQQELDFDSLSEKCKLMWCKGFGLGDGTIEYGDKDKDGKNIKANRTRIRLCGDKGLRFLDRFNINGCGIRNTTFENSNDKEVVIYNYHKEIPLFDTVEEITCFLNGLYCADGNITTNENKINFRLQSSKPEVIDFIRQYADVCGLYITKERDVTDEQTNFGTRPYTIAFSFNPDFSYNYTVIDKEFVKEDKVWCLEVEDTHNFILQYGIPTGNCCLVNLKDMLQNGTVINRKFIRKPNSFAKACTIATQIVQQIANGQYGGQTISLAHLAPFVRISYNKAVDKYTNRGCTPEQIEQWATEDIKKEIKDGIQTIQYQINTFSTCNGQAPFLSIFMYLNEEPEYIKETAMLIEEMLKQRIMGMQNEVGAWITPAFPKLLYVTDENNIYPDSEYFYLTKLAAECVSKRMLPDFISAKIMKQNYDGEVFPCMGCRSFLGPYKDENGKYKWYGRFNQGVVTLNLVDVGLSADKDIDEFWKILDARLELCFQALMLRHNRLLNTPLTVSPIHWKYGGLSRLDKDNFNDLLFNNYSSISLGYAGLYECVLSLIGESHTSERGEKLALDIMNHLRDTTEKWKKETNIGFSLYGTPLESTTYKLAKCLKKRFGYVPGVTDHDYITNSYHVNVREEISAEDKLKFESQFQSISSGGAISYVETCNLSHNPEAIIQLIQYMYENIQYAEINGKFDYCQECNFSGEMLLDDNNEWYCPNCGNRNHNKLNIARRTCGYIGDNFWNKGRTSEIKDRYVHVDNKPIDFKE